MDFETAVLVSVQVERSFPTLSIGGFRRLSREREDSWAVISSSRIPAASSPWKSRTTGTASSRSTSPSCCARV